MTALDWAILAGYCLFVLLLGFWAQSRQAGKDTESYFLSRRNLPWWIAGASMAASAFSIDTPLYVAKLTQEGGIQANWEWWFAGISGILSATIIARYWRRAGIMTDLELITLRYSGRVAHVLRAFRALFFGLLINPLAMAAVVAAVIKFLGVLDGSLVDARGWPEGTGLWVVAAVVGVTVCYSVLSGFMGVVLTDLLQFVVSFLGATIMAVAAVGQAGGLEALTSAPQLAGKLDFLPSFSLPWEKATTAFAIFVGVSWWTFVNADGGGKYIQRMASCKSEDDAEKASWFSTLTFVALRSWPWILTALAGLIIFPDLRDPEALHPKLMLQLSPGVRGLVLAAFVAAFMSTIDTQLNWGSSYLVNDLLRPYLLKERSERFYVWCARLCALPTLLFMGLFFYLSKQESSGVLSVTTFLRGVLLVSSGLGAVYLLRWFWWRLSAWAEIAAMIVAPVVAWLCKQNGLEFAPSTLLVTSTTVAAAWLVSCFGPQEGRACLEAFVARVRPPGFWGPLRSSSADASGGLWLALRFLAGNAILFGACFALGGILLCKGFLVVGFNLCLLGAGLVLDRWARSRLVVESGEPGEVHV